MPGWFSSLVLLAFNPYPRAATAEALVLVSFYLILPFLTPTFTPHLHQDAMKLPVDIDGLGVKILCYRHKVLSDGSSPIIVQLIHHGKIRRYSTGHACAVDRWDFEAERIKPWSKSAKEINAKLNAREAKIQDIVVKLYAQDGFSLEAFDRRYTATGEVEDVLAYLVQLADNLQIEGRSGNAATYRNTWRVLTRYTNGKAMRFSDLTPSKLEAFEKDLRSRGCADASISVYMRTLRAAVNKACRDGFMDRSRYPFSTGTNDGYELRMKGNPTPRALSESDLAKIKAFNYDEHPHLGNAVRYFLFSYYARGMNFVDMAHLERRSVKGGRFEYVRRKTMHKSGGVAFSIPVTPPMEAVIAAFEENGGRYVFPVLSEAHKTEKQRWDRIRKCLKAWNAQLKEVAEVLGIGVSLTSYVARHTYATTLKRKGVDLALIGDSMGHRNATTTAVYLKRFADDVLDAANAAL